MENDHFCFNLRSFGRLGVHFFWEGCLFADYLPTVPLNVVLYEGDPVGGGDGEREEGADWPHEEAHQDQQLLTGLGAGVFLKRDNH